MGGDARLNLLLTHEESRPYLDQSQQPWYRTISHMLAPLGVRTFEATSGAQAVEFIERHPIHVAIVDSRLPAISGLNILQLVQKLCVQKLPPVAGQPESTGTLHLQMRVEQRTDEGVTQRRIDVKVNARPAPPSTPTVILLTPPQHDDQLLHEALKFNAFSVLSEPVDVNLLLDLMARALRKFHQNQWPQ